MNQPHHDDADVSQRDLSARAAWLSYVGGLTQDQIAQELGISRQRVQRLVARAGAEGLIRVRIDHPIAECLELEREVRRRFGLDAVWIAPSAGTGGDPVIGLATFAAPILERMFAAEEPRSFAVGTGRTLRMIVDRMQRMQAPQHKIISLIGNVAPDGSASFYEVIMLLADRISAQHYPMSAPVVASSEKELELYRSLPHVKATRTLAETADLAIVGIGQMDQNAPLLVDGFITQAEHAQLVEAGGVGEICGHIFDKNGQFLTHPIAQRVVGTRVPVGDMPVYCIGGGASKLAPLRAALKGGLLKALLTDETTARELLTDQG